MINNVKSIKFFNNAELLCKVGVFIAIVSAVAISVFLSIEHPAIYLSGLILFTSLIGWSTIKHGKDYLERAIAAVKDASRTRPPPSIESEKTSSHFSTESFVRENNSEESFFKMEKPSPGNRVAMCQKTIFQLATPLGDQLRACKNEVNAFFLGLPHRLSRQDLRAIGAMLGGITGDALFSHVEFMAYKQKEYQIPGERITMCQGRVGSRGEVRGFLEPLNHFHLESGQWTDDGSMQLCLADCLLFGNGKFYGTDFMKLCCNWWDHGLNNAFRLHPKGSVGLGGNVATSFEHFRTSEYPRRATYHVPPPTDNNPFTSGNGSLMRLAPIVFIGSEKEVMDLAAEQSYATHPGREAAECCQVMAYIMYHFLHREGGDDPREIAAFKKKILEELPIRLTDRSFLSSVKGLVSSATDVPNDIDPKQLENWNWRDPNFDYNPSRIKQKPGYIGSYAMDALAMALHCIYTTDSFEEAVVKAGKWGGDADSVATITAQIAGILYGIQAVPLDWIQAVHQHDGHGEIAARSLALLRLRASSASR